MVKIQIKGRFARKAFKRNPMSEPNILRQPPGFKSGSEHFQIRGYSAGFTLGDYWQWMGSDVVSNIQRGVLAEYIVAKALGVADGFPRSPWEDYDVQARSTQTGETYELEVKSAAYVQSWHRISSRASVISFNIAPSTRLSKLFGKSMRSAWAYVFCILGEPDMFPDPLDLSQWEFYVVTTAALDQERPEQKTIRLRPLQELVGRRGLHTAKYDELLETIEELFLRDPPEGDLLSNPQYGGNH